MSSVLTSLFFFTWKILYLETAEQFRGFATVVSEVNFLAEKVYKRDLVRIMNTFSCSPGVVLFVMKDVHFQPRLPHSA